MDEQTGRIIGVAVSGFLGLLLWTARRGRPTIVDDGGTLMFRHGVIFRGFAYFSAFVIPLAVSVVVVLAPPRNRDDLLAILGIYAMFAALGLPLWWEASRFALLVTPMGLDCRSPWKGEQFFDWAEVEEISFSAMNRWFIILAHGGRKFRVPIFVPGLTHFLERCEQNLPAEMLTKARLGYLQIGRPMPGA